MCDMYPWLKARWVRGDSGQDSNENVSTKEICFWFETDQSQTFAVLCALWALPSQPNPRVSYSNCLGWI